MSRQKNVFFTIVSLYLNLQLTRLTTFPTNSEQQLAQRYDSSSKLLKEMVHFHEPSAKASSPHSVPAKAVYVPAYSPTRNSSTTVATSRSVWMVFILWLAVGFERYRAGSEQHIYSNWLRAIPLYSAT